MFHIILSFFLSFAAVTPSKEEVKKITSTYEAKNFDNLLGLSGFSDQLLKQHFELYQGYVNQTNILDTLLTNLLEAPEMSAAEYSALKKAYAFEYNGMKLHELYFDNLDKSGAIDTASPLYQKIIQSFGSFELWQKDFVQTGLSRGIGWVMCFYDQTTQKLINTWIESHDKGVPIYDDIILIMDCWEHAYLQDYGIKRKDYIQAFMNHIKWSKAQERYQLRMENSKT